MVTYVTQLFTCQDEGFYTFYCVFCGLLPLVTHLLRGAWLYLGLQFSYPSLKLLEGLCKLHYLSFNRILLLLYQAWHKETCFTYYIFDHGLLCEKLLFFLRNLGFTNSLFFLKLLFNFHRKLHCSKLLINVLGLHISPFARLW
jgi:hypothetical protein